MRPRIPIAVVLVALVALGGAAATISVSACRQDEPAGDPKTPANSPIPKIDRDEEEPKPAPKLPLGDAG